MDDESAFKTKEIHAGELSASGSLEWYKKTHGIRSTIEVATAIRHLCLSPDLRLLDAGAGVGRLTLEAAPLVGQVVAVDISPANISQLLKHSQERGLRNVSGFASDLNELNLPVGGFDRAAAIEVLQHIPSQALRQDAATRICRALKPNGIFVT